MAITGIPTAGFSMAPRKHTGTRMGLLQQRCTGYLLYVLSLLEAAGTLTLMVYALLCEAGNLVDIPDKRIGFYNFCLWNETAGELQCLDYKHLQVMGISLPEMALARVCVYTCLVFSIFYPLFVVNVQYTEQREGWKVILIILFIQMIILSGGLGMFLLQTSQWIHPSDFTGGFLALLGTQALLLLQILTATMYLSWVKYPHKCQRPFIEKVLPTEI
ncbi:transmembrane protein 140 [Corapipo altera]|uniref:transmembrane protein 140 n=1 Tax=Corapipo altera TaxID=415028 RepID=UPI000FD6B2C3|nr:transmembrane protein 140 [Corapipo altera]XP_027516301.1 transmembrane protein 140 [Corapipo altera]